MKPIIRAITDIKKATPKEKFKRTGSEDALSNRVTYETNFVTDQVDLQCKTEEKCK